MLLTNFTTMFLIPQQLRIFQRIFIPTNMETAEYWPMPWEYGIWNATIASLQFWAEDLNPITLGIASECVYTTFFWTPTSHILWQLSEEVLFECFVLALNAAFTQQLSLEDEGYESGSNNDLPTPLWKTPCILHVSSMEHAYFDPAHTMPCHPADTPHYNTQPASPRPVHHCLMFLSDSSESDQDPDGSSDNDQNPDTAQTYSTYSDMEDSTSEYSDAEEDFQTVPMDDEHWTTEIAPERTFCIHENGLPNNICQYPCLYGNNNDNSVSYMDSLDLSKISDYEDYMLTTSNEEELPGLEELPYWTLVCLNTYLTFKS